MTTDVPGGQPERPAIVVTAIRLLYLTLVLGVVRSILELPHTSQIASTGFALFVIGFTLGLMAWLIHMTGRGRNWARITFLVLFILGLPLSIHPLLQSLQRSPISGVLGLSQVVLQTVALVMLFTQSARPWFRQIAKPIRDNSKVNG